MNWKDLRSGGTEDNHTTSVRTASAQAKIQTKHLPNTSLQHYDYTTLLSSSTEMCLIKTGPQLILEHSVQGKKKKGAKISS
jgi:hypothetical protein